MNDFSKLYEQMIESGQQMARAMNPAMENFQASGFEDMMPKMPKEFMEMVWGNAFNKDGLTAKQRLMAMIAGMTVQGVPPSCQCVPGPVPSPRNQTAVWRSQCA